MKRTAFIVCSFCMALCACNNGEPGGFPLANHRLQVQFVHSDGKNILDSLLMNEADYVAADSFCTVSCMRLSDGDLMDLGEGNGMIGPKGIQATGKSIYFSWLDLKIRDDEYHYSSERAEEYDETYLLSLSSPVIFGDSILHNIKVHIHVTGCQYEYRQIDVDGKVSEMDPGQANSLTRLISATFVIP